MKGSKNIMQIGIESLSKVQREAPRWCYDFPSQDNSPKNSGWYNITKS